MTGLGFALTSAVLSAICMALMIVSDRVMVADCYRGNANQAWFVSSLAGGILGLLFTGAAWLATVATGQGESLGVMLAATVDSFLWRGLAMCALGALAVQTLLHYFRLQAARMHAAAIAAWLAAMPLFVYAGMLTITLLAPLDGVTTTSLHPLWVAGLVVATVGLVAFERATTSGQANTRIYRRDLVMLMMISVLYMILMRQLGGVEEAETDAHAGLTLMPYYWIGFLAGGRVAFGRRNRRALTANLRRRARFFIVPIIVTEIIGMLVFGFEYFALMELDPALVSLVVGAHVLLVYAMHNRLVKLRATMRQRGLRRLNWYGFRISAAKLPAANFVGAGTRVELAAMVATIMGLALALSMTPAALQ